MPVTITINNNNAQALAFVEYAKKLDFTLVEGELEVQKELSVELIGEDEYGIPIEHRDFLMNLSKEVKKNAAKRFKIKNMNQGLK